MGYDPNEPRDAEGKWTDSGDAIRAAASDVLNIKDKFIYKKEELTLYRGDTRDKGDIFTDKFNDYIFDGEIKNKAGFHFFTDDKQLAEQYATSAMNATGRKNEGNPILTKVETKKLNLLDLKSKVLTYGDLNESLFAGKMTKLDYVKIASGGLSKDKYLEEVAFPKMKNESLPHAAHLSNGNTGVFLKEKLQDAGYDGYVFHELKTNFAIIESKSFSVKERKSLKQMGKP